MSYGYCPRCGGKDHPQTAREKRPDGNTICGACGNATLSRTWQEATPLVLHESALLYLMVRGRASPEVPVESRYFRKHEIDNARKLLEAEPGLLTFILDDHEWQVHAYHPSVLPEGEKMAARIKELEERVRELEEGDDLEGSEAYFTRGDEG